MISAISTAVLIVLLIAHRVDASGWGCTAPGRPGDARLFVAACAATIVALLVCGKVLSPQFMVWLLPVGFVVAGRYGPAAAAADGRAPCCITFAYFPHPTGTSWRCTTGPIALLVLRDTPSSSRSWRPAGRGPSIAGQPLGRVLGRERTDPPARGQAVSARYLID